ncbi:hypothetical protein NC996_12335 [Trichocoleus sp. ST-U2]|uniref:hypothetical protein n=1 Tax=Coleofasciculus sp. FACHB-SPT9 TaxID=2692791 RepID=UPI001687EB6D|nr:hypothetical protein [Coleofasciculus sp. FACHB-SPT9]MBD1892953.1 hypothetical protein [Coleofasciculus sp. FACHB-SPT9]
MFEIGTEESGLLHQFTRYFLVARPVIRLHLELATYALALLSDNKLFVAVNELVSLIQKPFKFFTIMALGQLTFW